jgi:hypothetical protein
VVDYRFFLSLYIVPICHNKISIGNSGVRLTQSQMRAHIFNQQLKVNTHLFLSAFFSPIAIGTKESSKEKATTKNPDSYRDYAADRATAHSRSRWQSGFVDASRTRVSAK